MSIYTPFLKFFRPRRLRAFYRLLNVTGSTRVLDIGGGAFFWDLALSEDLPLPQVTVLNIRPAGDDARSFLRWIVADARASQLPDNSFDLVFSNLLGLNTWEILRARNFSPTRSDDLRQNILYHCCPAKAGCANSK